MTKEEKLSTQEQERVARFNHKEAELSERGYQAKKLTISIKDASIFSVILMIISGVLLLTLFNHSFPIFKLINEYIDRVGIFVYLAVMMGMGIGLFVLTVIHEWIHGLTWGIFAEHHLQDIEYGFLKEKMAPYCYCQSPLHKGAYLIGTLMPLIILGFLPTIYAFMTGNLLVLILAWIMIASAAGDIMVAYKVLNYSTQAKDVLYFDHPIEAGVVVFERNKQ